MMHEKLSSALKMHSAIAQVNGRNDQIFNVNGQKAKNLKYCHKLVRETAQRLAGEVYEAAMRDNDNYATWKLLCNDLDDKYMLAEWIKLMWPRMLDDARHTLAGLLSQPIDEGLKKAIHDALIKDGEIRGQGRHLKRQFQV